MRTLTPAALRDLLTQAGELALIDVREHGVFGNGHLLFAACIPLSHLEMRVADLVPNMTAPVVLCDAGPVDKERLARAAAEKLVAYGYTNVSILAGGTDAWAKAGFEIFSGVNVPSKAFGEYVEHNDDTPRITADELIAMQKAKEDLVILDSRPMDEFNRMSIPGGIDCPGAELVYRIHQMAPDPQTTVVVNCAGRTRSIIGCQSLRNAGIPNRVVALKDGTMGWHLAGHGLAHDKTAMAETPDASGLKVALNYATHVASRFKIKHIDHAALKAFSADTSRTLYQLDVRTAREFSEGHLPGARHAPGGQLVQATDEYMVTRNARVVLIDDKTVRATMTASWLVQMGWNDVYVLNDAHKGQSLETGVRPNTLLDFKQCETVSARELKAVLDSGESTAIVDFANSLEFREGHIKGSWWAVRARLTSALQFKPAVGMIVATSPDGLLAHYAARDISALRPDTIVRVLEDGTEGWRTAGYPLEEGLGGDAGGKPDVNPDELDVFYKPYDFTSAAERRMQEYLDWEVALVEQIERDATAKFRRYPMP